MTPVSSVRLEADQSQLAASWTRLMAPSTGEVRSELISEAAEFLGLPIAEAHDRCQGAGARFTEEWTRTVDNPRDTASLARFYNQSDTELFELIEWHAADPIHYRTLILRDFALRRPGRTYLDYGSGIGSDAIVFGEAGFNVTLADISDILLAFATFRCKRRGLAVQTIDLKKTELPANTFDVVLCFDVLEHIPEPLPVVCKIDRALRSRGLLVVHAPFGEDPVHPMHVVHRDVVTPRMRSLGFQPLDCWFPPTVLAPRVYEKANTPRMDRVAYYVYDQYLDNSVGGRLARFYRTFVRRPAANLPGE